ncbi:MAG: Membrane-fusion protein-like protein, partial [Phycisphaerales bacterium]|nr:Membrane-fusion protein-like protein [Phycisphaerales bacterium]
DGNVVAVSAVITRCPNLERAQQRLTSMQLVAGYFELFTLRRNSDQARTVAQSHQHVLQLATSVATADGFESAGMNLCNELATRAHATRVSLGWLKGKNIKVVALSHTEQFDKKQELVVQLQKVMEECMDQEGVVQYDPNGKGTDNVTRDAAALSRGQGGHIVLSLPLRRKAEVIGVVTLEFLPQQKIGPQVANGLAIAVDLLAPQLYDRYQNDRYLVTKAALSTKELGGKVIGPKYMVSKLVAVGVVALAAFVVLFHPMYRVSAPFQFIPTARYTLTAPQDGMLADVATIVDPVTKVTRKMKPGDSVKKGQLLAKLDTRDVESDRNKALAEMSKRLSQAADYRGQPDKAAEALTAQLDAAVYKAQVESYDLQIEMAKIKSPIDGVWLMKDLEDKVGSRLRQGDELMVVGQPDQLKVEVSAAERDIQHLKLGQRVLVATNSLPGNTYDGVVDRIVPMSNVDQKAADSTFKVYATLKQSSDTWKPGMAGEARIEIEERPLWWILSHRLVDYVKMKTWF